MTNGAEERLLLLPEMFSRRFKTASQRRIPELPSNCDRTTRLDLFSQFIWDTADRILEATQAAEAKQPIPLLHITYADGSEGDHSIHIVQKDDFAVLLEVAHSYIDQHFLCFQLWDTDQQQPVTYPTDLLFRDDPVAEAVQSGQAKIEMFVRPVSLAIHSFRFDPSPFVPDEATIVQLRDAASKYPPYSSWEAFEQKDYKTAAARFFPFLAGRDATEPSASFVNAYYAVCEYLDGNYKIAAEYFLSAGSGYLGSGFPRNADACFCFAIEAGKRITDLNEAYRVLADVVAALGFLAADYKPELLNILKNYYSEVYIGAAVLCRRIIELQFTDLLVARSGKTIKSLTKAAKATGRIPKDARAGLFTVLALARLHGVITDDDHTIGTHIREFGNDIHEKGGGGCEVDAKYAVQSCIHLLHRV